MTNRTTALVRSTPGAAARADRAAAALETMASGGAVGKMTLEAFASQWRRGLDVTGGGGLGGPSNAFRDALWPYRAIFVISTCASGVPVRLSRGQAAGTRGFGAFKRLRVGFSKGRAAPAVGEKAHLKAREGDLIEGGDLYNLLDRPEPGWTWNQFFRRTVALMLKRPGRVLWHLDDMVGRRPRRLRIVPGDWTTPVTPSGRPDDDLLGWKVQTPWGYRYTLTLEESICWANLNPDVPHLGMSPEAPARLAIASDYNASLYNAAMFGNNAEPGGVLETEAPFNPDQNDQLRDAWSQSHGGPANARAMAILWGGLKWKPVASTMQDMQFEGGKGLSRTEEVAAWGVPEVVAGFYTDANYAFAEQGRMQFWQDTMMPLLDYVAEGLQIHLAPRFEGGQEVWFDLEDVPIVQQMRLARVETVTQLADRGVPMADLNDLYDLGLPDRPWYATGWIPAGMLPANLAAESERVPTEPETAPPEAGALGQAAKAPAPKKPVPNPKRVWEAWAASWQGLARQGRQILRVRYLGQEKALLKALKKALEAVGYEPGNAAGDRPRAAGLRPETCSLERSAKADYEPVVARVLMDVFEDPKDRKVFRARMHAYLTDGQELGLRQALSEAGLSGDALRDAMKRLMADPAILSSLQSESVRVSTLIDARTRRVLKGQLAEGLEAGETIRDLAGRVQSVMGNSRAQAMVVARNTVGQTLSRARHEGQRAGGMTHKKWLHSRGDGERRPAHVAAEAVYAENPIPLHQSFIVNGVSLLYPRDFSAGAPGETVNCQCVSVASRVGFSGEGPKAIEGPPERIVTWEAMLAAREAAREEEADDA